MLSRADPYITITKLSSCNHRPLHSPKLSSPLSCLQIGTWFSNPALKKKWATGIFPFFFFFFFFFVFLRIVLDFLENCSGHNLHKVHLHFHKIPCNWDPLSKATCSQCDWSHRQIQLPQENLSMMNRVRFHCMDSMNSLSLQNHTVEQIQIQSLVLADSPAISHG